MIIVIDKIPYRVLEIVKYNTGCDKRLEYRVTNGKYITTLSREEFEKGEVFV